MGDSLAFVETKALLIELQQRFHAVAFVGYQDRGPDTHAFFHYMHGDRFRIVGMLDLLTRRIFDDYEQNSRKGGGFE